MLHPLFYALLIDSASTPLITPTPRRRNSASLAPFVQLHRPLRSGQKQPSSSGRISASVPAAAFSGENSRNGNLCTLRLGLLYFFRSVGHLRAVEPFHIAAYVEELQQRLAAPSVKQRLAALRMLFDWLVVGQVMPSNPASVVRGPKHSVKKGKTAVLTAEEARTLLESIDTESVVGLRDRALIAL